MSSKKVKKKRSDPRQGACKFCGFVTTRKERHERGCALNTLKAETSTTPSPSQTVQSTNAGHEIPMADDTISEVNLVQQQSWMN